MTYSNLQQRKEIKRQQYAWKSFFFFLPKLSGCVLLERNNHTCLFLPHSEKHTAVTEKKRDFQAERFANGRQERKRQSSLLLHLWPTEAPPTGTGRRHAPLLTPSSSASCRGDIYFEIRLLEFCWQTACCQTGNSSFLFVVTVLK